MATILDPDYLQDSDATSVTDTSANVFINEALRTVRLNNGAEPTISGAAPGDALLDNTGVTLQALYSFLKVQWKDDPKGKSLISYPFPLIAITPEQFEWQYGWAPADDSSRSLLRTAGWREYNVDNSTLLKQYMGVITLGNINGDQTGIIGAEGQSLPYYAFFNSSTLAPTSSPFDFNYPGAVNQAVKTFEDGGNDYRGDTMTVFIRTQGQTYGQTNTTDIGIPAGTSLPYNVQRFPLSEGTDLDVTVSDAVLFANSNAGQKYDSADNNGPTIRYLSTAELSGTFGYTKDLVNNNRPFGILIDADDGSSGLAADKLSINELYSWVQWRLRSNENIEDSAGANKIGRLQDELLEFVGPTLKTKNATNIDGGGSGVAITNFAAGDVNSLAFRDNNQEENVFPFTATGKISFSQDILNDSVDAKFFMYYEYTREYSGNITINNVGAAASDATVDSANFVLTGFTGTLTDANCIPVQTVRNAEGITTGNYFKLGGASNTNNNQIWKITNVAKTPDSAGFSAITFDDLPAADATSFAGTIKTWPINSPDATLVDSAGATVENQGGISATLSQGTAGIGATLTGDNEFQFEYDYQSNSQRDKLANTSPDIIIRAIGLANGSFVEQPGTIARSTTNSYSVVSAVERNYSDPATFEPS